MDTDRNGFLIIQILFFNHSNSNVKNGQYGDNNNESPKLMLRFHSSDEITKKKSSHEIL